MKVQLVFYYLLIASVTFLHGAAANPVSQRETLEILADHLKYQQGVITLGDGLAKLRVQPEFHYLDADLTQIVLEKLWRNPPGPKTLGMLLPSGVSPIAEDEWGIVITYEENGYVKDDDADTINYSELLKEMQEDTRSINKERLKQGYDPVELVGWATPPHYDKVSNKLYWAKELRFGNDLEHTLNYNIRILGRRGVLVLNAVAAIGQLSLIERRASQVLLFVEFNEGHRYADFRPGVDKIATYGIAALVAGKVAAKVGLLKGFGVVILAAKKFVIIGLVAIWTFIRKLFRKRQVV